MKEAGIRSRLADWLNLNTRYKGEMMKELLKEFRSEASDLETLELLDAALNKFGDKLVFASSFSAEDQVITDMLCRISGNFRIFTLDTGRLPDQTYKLIERTRRRYGIPIKILFPDYVRVEGMVNDKGPDLFYRSIENRKLCCRIRKLQPLRRILTPVQAWICGLRRDQSGTRSDIERIQWDSNFEIIKISPLADWSIDRVWKYIRDNDVPYSPLYDAGYTSIGCAPCTRSVKPGENLRSGRWWWELPEHKECGLHLNHKNSKSEVNQNG